MNIFDELDETIGDSIDHFLEIEFLESVKGTEKVIQIEKLVGCPTCKGSRAKQGIKPSNCSSC